MTNTRLFTRLLPDAGTERPGVMKMEILQTSDLGHLARAVHYLESEGYRHTVSGDVNSPDGILLEIEISEEEQDTGRMLSEHVRFDPVISGRPKTEGKRVYNEIYCHPDHTVAVEKAIVDLRMEHPEWELDMSIGAGNWEDAED